MTQTGEQLSPVESFILSSWSHTIGPQVLMMWKPKTNETDILTKDPSFARAEVHAKGEVCTGSIHQQQYFNRSVGTFVRNESNVSFVSHHKHYDHMCYLNGCLGSNLEEFIFMDDHNDNCSSSEDIVIKAVGKLLLGELENYPSPSGCYSRLFLLPDKNTILATNLFTSASLSLNGKLRDAHHLSLSVVFNCDNRDFIFGIYAIIDLMLRREVSFIQQLKVLSVDDIRLITPHLSNICDVVFDLHSNFIKHKSVPYVTALEDTSAENIKFLERSFASHFQSCNCSTVIGESEYDINKMIHALQLFQDANEKCCLNYYSPNNRSSSYQPGLFIQGLLKDNYGKSDLWFHDLKYHPCPMTVIDVCQKKVRTTLHSPTICQQEAEESSTQPDLLKVASSLQTVTDSGKLVPNMLCESRILNGHPLAQEAHARHFSRYLSLTASSLIKLTERYREMNISTTPKVLKTVLGHSETPDLKAIIGSAEKLKVGICAVYIEK